MSFPLGPYRELPARPPIRYLVVHWALRYGEWEMRLMYEGRSRWLARLVARITYACFAQYLDYVQIEEQEAFRE